MTNMYIQKIDQPNGTVLISYELTNLDTANLSYDMGITSNPLPENSDQNTVLVKVTGNSTDWDITWLIKESSTNKATGSGVDASTSTKTIWEQLQFFDKVFQATHIGDTYRVVIADSFSGGVYTNEYFRKEGALSSMKFPMTSLEPQTIRATVTLMVGTVIGSLDGDTPTDPLSITFSNPSHLTVDLGWTTPTDAGSSAITGYIIQRRSQTTSYTTVHTVGVTNSAVDTVTTIGTYYYQIAAISAAGTGLFSDEISLVVT